MERVPVGDRLVTSGDQILVAKASTANVDAPGPDRQPLVEVGSSQIAHVHLGGERFDSLIADRLISARVELEVLDACNLEPDEERRMVGDALRVGLGEAHLDLGREREAFHGPNPRIQRCLPLI